ncbi:TPA: DNA adenine modification methylase, partial [Neisseria gonorrhoeae]
MVERMAAGRLVDEIIKIQHNCVSDSRQYGGKLVRIAHEKLLVFKKEIQTALYFLAKAMNRVEAVTAVTWKAAVRRVLQAADGRDMGLMEIYGEMEPYAAARAENRNWQAKVRQVLQDERFFLRVGKGIYALKTE